MYFPLMGSKTSSTSIRIFIEMIIWHVVLQLLIKISTTTVKNKYTKQKVQDVLSVLYTQVQISFQYQNPLEFTHDIYQSGIPIHAYSHVRFGCYLEIKPTCMHVIVIWNGTINIDTSILYIMEVPKPSNV